MDPDFLACLQSEPAAGAVERLVLRRFTKALASDREFIAAVQADDYSPERGVIYSGARGSGELLGAVMDARAIVVGRSAHEPISL